ncbi:uncharacterized protein METZ01_LOCUS316856, partial [marine metagenome]
MAERHLSAGGSCRSAAASASRSGFGFDYLGDGETKASLSNRAEPE